MLAADRHPEASRGTTRRPTVRIVRRRTLSRATAISLALVTLAALAFPAIWRLKRSDEPIRALQRRFEDVEMEWKCPLGHVLHAAGQAEPRRCWVCDREAYPVTHFTCPVHGAVEVLVKFRRAADGFVEMAEVRAFSGGPWEPIAKGATCPRCTRKLRYAGDDPLDAARRGQKRPGG